MLTRVGPYKVTRLVGRGGLGVVYHAFDTRSREQVAIKFLNRPAEDTTAARRLAREFKALSGLEHRNIVRVVDAGNHDEVPFLVMEFVDGLPLRNWLDATYDDPEWAPRPPPPPGDESGSVSQPGPPPPPEPSADGSEGSRGSDSLSLPAHPAEEPDSVPSHLRLLPLPGAEDSPQVLSPASRAALNRPQRISKLRDVIAQLADGLAFIHARGLVHRDLKPSNILVSGGCAKLVDFGLVKVTSGSGNTTATGHVVGTYRYMSPEQARGGQVDGRSDLYALGGVLYEMLCGRPPFAQQQTAALLQAIVHRPAPLPKLINPEADGVLADMAMMLLQKHPDDRVQTAEEVAALIRASKPAMLPH